MDTRDDDKSWPGRPVPHHTFVPGPKHLPGFPGAVRAYQKGGRKRWKDPRGRIYEWDGRHGALEVYDAFGRHLGEFDHRTGLRLKPADARRRIEP